MQAATQISEDTAELMRQRIEFALEGSEGVERFMHTSLHYSHFVTSQLEKTRRVQIRIALLLGFVALLELVDVVASIIATHH